MNELFNMGIIEKNESKKSEILNSFLEFINKSTEYLKNLPANFKKSGLITIACSMGIFNIANAENNDSQLNEFTKGLDFKNSIENTIDSFYLNYKQANNDTTFSYLEYKDSEKTGMKENVEKKFLVQKFLHLPLMILFLWGTSKLSHIQF
jgi:hypothetical protein